MTGASDKSIRRIGDMGGLTGVNGKVFVEQLNSGKITTAEIFEKIDEYSKIDRKLFIACLFIGTPATEEGFKKRRNELLKAYHSDVWEKSCVEVEKKHSKEITQALTGLELKDVLKEFNQLVYETENSKVEPPTSQREAAIWASIQGNHPRYPEYSAGWNRKLEYFYSTFYDISQHLVELCRDEVVVLGTMGIVHESFFPDAVEPPRISICFMSGHANIDRDSLKCIFDGMNEKLYKKYPYCFKFGFRVTYNNKKNAHEYRY